MKSFEKWGINLQELGTPALAGSVFLLFLTIGLGYFAEQSSFTVLVSLYAPFWIGYVWLIRSISTPSEIRFLLCWSILLRAVLVFSFPNLSDDVYRFIWDGHLITNGYNPFHFLPKEVLDATPSVPGLTPELFAELNSQDYYTVYPPIAQLTFALAVFLFPGNWWANAVVMKVFLFAFEVGSLVLLTRLLRHFGLPQKNVLWYALNPLILIEITGNLHFEGGMIFFLLLSLWWLVKGRYAGAAVAMAGAIASKLLPLLFLPFLIRRLGWKRSIRFFTVVALALIALFSPLINMVFLRNFADSLDLYFRNFEFNGSIYYLVRWVGFQVKGYNIIAKAGPYLALSVFVIIVLKALLERKQDWLSWPVNMLFAISVYLFLGTTIHPWYTSLPIVLCLFTGFRFPILWSGLIMYTYINYSYGEYKENLWVVGFEYGFIFAFLLYEFFYRRKSHSAVEKIPDQPRPKPI